jgi:hypothetical protein
MATPRRNRTTTSAVLSAGPRAAATADIVPGEGKGGVQVKTEAWGEGNKFPQEALRILYDSGTATTCAERIEQFVVGKGFTSKITGSTLANPGQTFNELLAEAGAYVSVGLGVAYIVRHTFGGEPGEVYVAPVDCLRREDPKTGNRFIINPKLASGKMKAEDNEIYLPYDTQANAQELAEEVLQAVQSEAGYWGHLWWSFTKKVGRGRYPVPGWWSAKEAIEAEAEAPRYDLKQFRDRFLPDALLAVVGKRFTDEVPIEDWKPTGEQTEADRPFVESPDLLDLKKNVKALKGSNSESSVFLLAVETKEEIPDLKFFDQGPNSKNLTDATARLEGRVYRRMGVPPVLCGVSEPGLLGSNQQIVNSIQLFGLVVNPARELVVGPLRQLFPALDFTVTPLDPVDYIDPAVAAKMTDDELRATRGLLPVEKPAEGEAEQTLAALNGLSPLVATKVLNEMTSEEIRALIGLAAKEVQTPKPRAK